MLKLTGVFGVGRDRADAAQERPIVVRVGADGHVERLAGLVSLVTVSLTVTVTSALPVVPIGAESRNTPSWVSVKSVALVIVTVLSGLVVRVRRRPQFDLVENVAPRSQHAEDRVAEIARAVGSTVMKNCEPLVSGPLLAIASTPGPVNCSAALNSSSNLYPGPPVPSPLGSPPWIMKSLITRWNVRLL